MKLKLCPIGSALIFVALAFLPGCGSARVNNPPEMIAPTSGTPQSAAVNAAFASPFVGTVTMGGSPINGALVTFTAPLTGATGTFAGGTNTVTVTATSSGVATAPAFTANTTAGTYAVTATVSGVSASTTFSLTNTSGPAASIAATSGTPQTTTISTAFAEPLVATVEDSYNNLVSGAVVTFTAPTAGASGTFTGAVSTVTATTNASGVAMSPVFTANAKPGNYRVTASVSGVATTINFKLSNTTTQAETIAATSGTLQTAAVNAAFAAPLVATVTAGGAPVSGVVVTFTPPKTGAGGTFAGGLNTATTDVNGVATSALFTANGTVGAYTVAASVAGNAGPADFSLTNAAVNYAFYLNGSEAANNGPNFYALAGAVSLDGNGNVLGGEQDYNDGLGFTSPQPSGDSIGGGTLTVDPNTGQGTLTLITNNANLGVSGTETLGVQFVNTNHALVIQFDGSATSSGSMDLQTLPSTLSGGYAFTLTGVDFNYLPVVYGGVLSIGGTTFSGTADTNDNGTVLIGTSFSGTINAADAFGRGNIPGTTFGDKELTLNYYVVGPEAIRIIDVDANDAGIGSAYGQGSGTFGNTSLGSSVFGFASNSFGALYATAGQIATSPAGGTFQGVADDNELDNGITVTAAPISGTYSIGTNGYGSLTIAAGDLGDVSALGIYMTDPNLNLNDPNNTTSGLGGALVTDLDTTLNGTGILIPQTDTNTASFTGNYAFGAQDYNFLSEGDGWEFDFVGQGAVTSLALKGTGLASDPWIALGANPTDSPVRYSGTAAPDGSNAGRYTIPFAIAFDGIKNDFSVVIYQANGGELLWLDEDDYSVFLGSLQQQGSLTALPAVALPAVMRAPAKAK
jgi:hypothetical protein